MTPQPTITDLTEERALLGTDLGLVSSDPAAKILNDRIADLDRQIAALQKSESESVVGKCYRHDATNSVFLQLENSRHLQVSGDRILFLTTYDTEWKGHTEIPRSAFDAIARPVFDAITKALGYASPAAQTAAASGELLPCPCCGGSPYLDRDSGGRFIECSRCVMRTMSIFDDGDVAITTLASDWNRRAPAPARDARSTPAAAPVAEPSVAPENESDPSGHLASPPPEPVIPEGFESTGETRPPKKLERFLAKEGSFAGEAMCDWKDIPENHRLILRKIPAPEVPPAAPDHDDAEKAFVRVNPRQNVVIGDVELPTSFGAAAKCAEEVSMEIEKYAAKREAAAIARCQEYLRAKRRFCSADMLSCVNRESK